MRKGIVVVVVWVALFGATLGIRAIAADSDAAPANGGSSRISAEIDAIHVEMEAKTRRSIGIAASLNAEDAIFVDRVRQLMMSHDADLRRCRDVAMLRSSRQKEFFEVSFVPEMHGALQGLESAEFGRKRRIKLGKVAFERASLDTSSQDEECITRAFAAFELEAGIEIVPAVRIPFEFCFGRLQKQPN